MTLGEKVYEFESEISDYEFALGERERILKLKTLDEVKNYYLDDRNWCCDNGLMIELINLIIRLKEYS